MAAMSGVSRRMYSTGFMISQFMYVIGGMGMEGECLDDMLMLDTQSKMCRTLSKDKNNSLRQLKPVCSAACVGAFYSSRYGKDGINLSLDRVMQEIDWSVALSLIKYEGVYMFGGRDNKNTALNRLLCIQFVDHV